MTGRHPYAHATLVGLAVAVLVVAATLVILIFDG